jgi:hypothetical protein
MNTIEKLEADLVEAREWCDTLSDALAGSDPVGVPKGVLDEFLELQEQWALRDLNRSFWVRENRGNLPCIPPATLRGMIERIYLRLRVERDNLTEAFD